MTQGCSAIVRNCVTAFFFLHSDSSSARDGPETIALSPPCSGHAPLYKPATFTLCALPIPDTAPSPDHLIVSSLAAMRTLAAALLCSALLVQTWALEKRAAGYGGQQGGAGGYGGAQAASFGTQGGYGAGSQGGSFGVQGGASGQGGYGSQGGAGGSSDYSDYESGDEIPGTPGQDYPIFSEVPPTGFSCQSQQYPGYYGDVDARCQVFHICQENGHMDSFLCPNGSIFHQQYFVCDWYFNVDCASSPNFYSLNAEIGKSPAGGYGAQGGFQAQGGYGGSQGTQGNYGGSQGTQGGYGGSQGGQGGYGGSQGSQGGISGGQGGYGRGQGAQGGYGSQGTQGGYAGSQGVQGGYGGNQGGGRGGVSGGTQSTQGGYGGTQGGQGGYGGGHGRGQQTRGGGSYGSKQQGSQGGRGGQATAARY